MEQLYEKYLNIQIFLTKYRNYALLDGDFHTFEVFKNKIQLAGYVMHSLKHNEKKEEADVFLFKKDAAQIKTTSEFVKILDRYRTQKTIFMVVKNEPKTNIKKAIKRYKDLNIHILFHKLFLMEVNKGPLCSPHRILSIEETRQVCFDLMAHAHRLPAICEDDPQNIWIGGRVNDVIEITTDSEKTGTSVHYRIVIPSSGRVDVSAASKNPPGPDGDITDDKPDADADADEADADDDVGADADADDDADAEDDDADPDEE